MRQRLGMETAEAAQRILHRGRTTHQVRGTGICTELTLAREVSDDDTGQHTKDHLTNHAGDHVADTWAAILLPLAQE